MGKTGFVAKGKRLKPQDLRNQWNSFEEIL